MVGVGSSPLTRGKRLLKVCDLLRRRLIPAHAGKTPAARPPRRTPRAHPRSRGENSVDRKRAIAVRGSSPLTRGKQQGRRRQRHVAGLIPAHAGKTPKRRASDRVCAAHPRSRGENANSGLPVVSLVGSSPLTRGKLQISFFEGRGAGLIPAHAGKTLEWA